MQNPQISFEYCNHPVIPLVLSSKDLQKFATRHRLRHSFSCSWKDLLFSTIKVTEKWRPLRIGEQQSCCGSVRMMRYLFSEVFVIKKLRMTIHLYGIPKLWPSSSLVSSGKLREWQGWIDWVIHCLKRGTSLIDKAILDWNEHQTRNLCWSIKPIQFWGRSAKGRFKCY